MDPKKEPRGTLRGARGSITSGGVAKKVNASPEYESDYHVQTRGWNSPSDATASSVDRGRGLGRGGRRPRGGYPKRTSTSSTRYDSCAEFVGTEKKISSREEFGGYSSYRVGRPWNKRGSRYSRGTWSNADRDQHWRQHDDSRAVGRAESSVDDKEESLQRHKKTTATQK